jgi:hypothetical protein
MTGPPGSWEEDRERKSVVGLEVSAEKRLAWLEEMLVIAFERGALPKARDAWGQPLPVEGAPRDAPAG